MKNDFSYQEKILRCSILIFHYVKYFFTLNNSSRSIAADASSKTKKMHTQLHSNKTAFTNEKNRFSLGKTNFLY